MISAKTELQKFQNINVHEGFTDTKWPPAEVLLKTAPQPVVDASAVIVN